MTPYRLLDQHEPSLTPPTLVGAFVVLGAVVGLVVCGILPVVPIWTGLGLGALVGYLGWTRIKDARAAVLGAWGLDAGGVAGDAEALARLDNLFEGLSLSSGVDVPDVVVLDVDEVNAAAVVDRTGATAVVTRGLLERCDRMQLEAVAAQLLVRIGSGRAERATLAAGLVGLPLIDGVGALSGIGADLLGRLLGGDGDTQTDLDTVELTRYPPGLCEALSAMATDADRLGVATAGTAHLWMVCPVDHGAVPRPLVQWRLDVLGEL